MTNNEREQRWHAFMCLAQQGDHEGYTQLLEEMREYMRKRYSSSLYRWGDVEDCVQDCLIRIHQARMSFDCSQRFMPWFSTIVRNKGIDHIKKRSRRMKREIMSEAYINNCAVPAPQLQIEAKLTTQKLLSKLSEDNQTIIQLSKLDGLSDREIAKQLKCSEGAVRDRVHRAIAKLKKIVEQQKKCDVRKICTDLRT